MVGINNRSTFLYKFYINFKVYNRIFWTIIMLLYRRLLELICLAWLKCYVQQHLLISVPQILANTVLLSALRVLLLQMPHIIGITHICPSDSLISLSIISSAFIHVVACGRIFLFCGWINPLYVYMIFPIFPFFLPSLPPFVSSLFSPIPFIDT